MRIPVIKLLAENHSTPELERAETALLQEENPGIHVPGDDAGEQLTHVLAAIDVHALMREKGMSLPAALRAFSQRVRNSIA